MALMGRYWILGAVVMLAVLARPDALLTFTVLSLAAGLSSRNRPLRPRHDTAWGQCEARCFLLSMSQSKREQVVSHLRYIRQELREMHQGVMEDGLLPESGEVRGVMAQMEALLELLEGKSSRKAKAESS